MNIALIYEFPPFDTGMFEGAVFTMAGADAQLKVMVAERSDITLRFTRIRWHEFTANYNCSREQISSAYFKLVELQHSTQLARYVANDSATRKAYRELHHFRVFLDEHGCHEVFAESVSAV